MARKSCILQDKPQNESSSANMTFRLPAALKTALDDVRRRANAAGKDFPATEIVRAALEGAVRDAQRELQSAGL